MFFLKRTHTVAIDEVQLEESRCIAERRAQHGIADHEQFAQLAETLDIPEAQRSGALRGLLTQLNDPEQTARWREHAARPEKRGMGNLVGLALSGGGIRSATFNLGVLQVLAWTKLLNFVDYLSTVSGGGYIGSFVSSMFASPLKTFPCSHRQGETERPIFRHLRNNAEYLAPQGTVDYLVIPMTVLRGMAINLLVILPFLMIAAMATAVLHPTAVLLRQHVVNRFSNDVPSMLGHSFIFTKVLLVIILASFVLFPIIQLCCQRATSAVTSGWTLRTLISRLYGRLLLLTLIVAFVELQPLAIDWLLRMHQADNRLALISGSITAVQTLVPAAISAWLLKNAEKLLAQYALALLGFSAILVFWVIYLWLCVWMIDGELATSLVGLSLPLSVTVALLLYAFVFVDVNHTSVHAFYRDRLSKAYIVKQGANEADIVPNDRQPLSTLNTVDGPYHLINAAINLRVTQESYRRGRHAESFVFSKHYVGSEPTGYCKTENMESQSRHLNLATAMAISGAAAAPNMGKQTNRLFAFFLAMLNVRLNYWLPNPRYAIHRKDAKLPRGPVRRVGPLYLLRELFGRLTDCSNNVNLSDGGHFDNLGLYELFRRECRLIVCGDGEADAHFQFNGLAEALRMVQIDFGIIVEMTGLDAIRAGKQNHALGRIRYADGRVGWLLYLKQSLRGDATLRATLEPERYAGSDKVVDDSRFDAGAYIAEYKSRHADFPHQSTADQFFDEAQFECTRAVGYNAVYRTLCN